MPQPDRPADLTALPRDDTTGVPPASGSRGLFFGIAALALAAVLAGVVMTRNLIEHHTSHEVAKLEAISTLKAGEIGHWLDERRRDADFIRTANLLNRALRQWQRHGDVPGRDMAFKRIETLRKIGGYQAILMIDETGRVLLGDGGHTRIAPPLRQALDRAFASGEIQFSDIYRDDTGGEEHMHLDFVAPLAVSPGQPGLALVLRVDKEEFLFPFLQMQPVPSASGETLLFRRDGDEVLLLNELRYRSGTALKMRLPMSDERLLAVQVASGRAAPGQMVAGLDYRGMPSVGVVRAVAGTSWFLVAKIDEWEIYEEARRDLILIAVALALTLLVLAAGGLLLHQRRQLQWVVQRKVVEESLRESEERLRLLIEHAPAALAMFDLDMRYLAVSHRWMTDFGLGERDIIGRSHYELFPEIAEALKAIHRRGMAGETVAGSEDRFERADGTVQWLRWEMRPWCQASGGVGGIVIFSEDITERKMAEEALKERNEELERFNRATIGREMDMIELKKQANALAKELGREPPFNLDFLGRAGGKESQA